MKTVRTYKRSMFWLAIFVGIITIWSELSAGVKDFLAGMTGHHWVTKSVFSIILFWIFVASFSEDKDSEEDPLNSARRIVKTVVFVSIVITGYYVWHYFA